MRCFYDSEGVNETKNQRNSHAQARDDDHDWLLAYKHAAMQIISKKGIKPRHEKPTPLQHVDAHFPTWQDPISRRIIPLSCDLTQGNQPIRRAI